MQLEWYQVEFIQYVIDTIFYMPGNGFQGEDFLRINVFGPTFPRSLNGKRKRLDSRPNWKGGGSPGNQIAERLFSVAAEMAAYPRIADDNLHVALEYSYLNQGPLDAAEFQPSCQLPYADCAAQAYRYSPMARSYSRLPVRLHAKPVPHGVQAAAPSRPSLQHGAPTLPRPAEPFR
ncbi:uncharacterized protein CEXT_209851 [Caerostris extrusa]|uniref:Uncharacterized protein n=1 Tax=Caerostris extrusa TaxID=172846 RepID=A0AAV4WKQ2_CAEEX|nr:uncharacterized protein CEXT_209851 [Caerostris extrusa]